ncbi:aldo/keto reductase [Chelativorans sp. AA-79]|uniref:aldo/keto reductase n=1 Tax=Chelativorans sp. AA-79 TaxID=3028735 RepID=UPI0023F8EA78|nr:aldo/keto reductase [Chelativorans sp. AA-79]WEX11112.1 aldo/keto reductase [Chelativorans sp. AA-79]
MPAENSDIPRIGLGTYGLTGAEGRAALSSAINLGYRHLDTAQTYGTEENVGEAVARSGLDRADFFVTTKVTASNLGRLAESVDDSLETMQLDYADLVLIHWPAPHDDPPVSAYIGALARVQDEGKTRLIGVSNFTRRHIDEAVAEIGEGRLATNQFEQHVFLQNRVLAAHCRERGIAVTAYMPLAGGRLGDDSVIGAVASKHGATASQVALAYLLALDSIVIPKSASPERQRTNLAAGDLVLDGADMGRLAGLERGQRYINPAWGPDWY